MVSIDGSYGEGGGQVLRTALSLATLTGTPVSLRNIRANRSKPGLAPQHLTAVRALAAICNASLTGAALRSTECTFEPSASPQPGAYTFDVADTAQGGSAGSVPLLFQAVLLPLAAADGASQLTLKGGTHVRWSPSVHYLQQVYLSTLFEIEVQASIEVQRYGFYPAGGGVLTATLPDVSLPLSALTCTERGTLQQIQGEAVSCNLPAHIAKRMARQATSRLDNTNTSLDIAPKVVDSAGPGAGLFLATHYEHSRAGFMVLGEPGKPSEQVADEACDALLQFHRADAPIDPHLADQLLLPLALADGQSVFRTTRITGHLQTNAHVIQQLIPATITVDDTAGEAGRVVVDGAGFEGAPADA